MQDTYDPFSYLLNEIRAHDAGQREDWSPDLRQHYLDELLVEEAQEIAWGRRHVTIVHGPVTDEVDAERLDDLFAAWESIASEAEWARIGGIPDHHMTLTVAGRATPEIVAVATQEAMHRRRDGWRVLGSALP